MLAAIHGMLQRAELERCFRCMQTLVLLALDACKLLQAAYAEMLQSYG